MSNRRTMSHALSKSIFIRAALKTHAKNLTRYLVRGGYRS